MNYSSPDNVGGREDAALLRLSDVGYAVGGPRPLTILRGINLSIFSGEFVSIVGPSGSGKSTLLNVLGLLDSATTGTYRVGGKDVSSLSDRRIDALRAETFGFVFQSSHVVPDDSVARNASMGLRIRNFPMEQRNSLTATRLAETGLLDKWDALGRTLSGGERQRVAIARAVVGSPAVILADEPTGNLDSSNSRTVVQLLQELNRAGHTIIVVTHDREVAAVADRMISIEDGKVVADSATRVSGDRASVDSMLTATVPAGRRFRPLDLVGDVLSSLTSRPFRTLSILAAFALGAGGLVAAVGISQTASEQVSERLNEAAFDEVSVDLPVGTDLQAADQYRDELDALPGTKHTSVNLTLTPADGAATLFAPNSVSGQESSSGPVVLADSDLGPVQDLVVEPEQALSLLDGELAGQVAIIGEDLAAKLGTAAAGPGSQLWIQGKPFVIVGVVHESSRMPSLLSSVIVPIRNVSELNVGRERIRLTTRTLAGYPAPLSEAIPVQLAPDNPTSIDVETVADLRAVQRGIREDLTAFVGVLSALLLVLACLSASVTMFLAVRSRTGEIALRRALGAKRADIRWMFILEGLLLGCGGGITGASFGIAATVLVSISRGWNPVLTLSVPLIGVAAGAITGIVAGAIPAISAARIHPAVAIRQA
jgi:macrolide transport system ATP-binding/permease protein